MMIELSLDQKLSLERPIAGVKRLITPERLTKRLFYCQQKKQSHWSSTQQQHLSLSIIIKIQVN